MCRSRRELSNEYLLAKIGVDTAENEPLQVCPLSAYRSPRLMMKPDLQVDCLYGADLPEKDQGKKLTTLAKAWMRRIRADDRYIGCTPGYMWVEGTQMAKDDECRAFCADPRWFLSPQYAKTKTPEDSGRESRLRKGYKRRLWYCRNVTDPERMPESSKDIGMDALIKE